MADDRRAALIEQIEAAFQAVPMPDPASFGRLNPDERWCAERFAGRARPDVEINDNLTECLLGWMPPEAIHYFIPAFLIHYLRPDQQDNHWATNMKSYLDPRGACTAIPFTRPQREAIAAWFDLMRYHLDDEFDGIHQTRWQRQFARVRDQWLERGDEA